MCLKVSDETQQLRKKQNKKGARDNVYILFYYVNFLFFFFRF